MKHTRIISALLALLICAALFAACSPAKIALIKDGAAEYNIIVAPDAGRAVTAAAEELKTALFTSTGSVFSVLTSDSEETAKEILLGVSARADSTAARDALATGGYSVGTTKEGKIVIAGKTPTAVAAAADEFISAYLDGVEGLVTLDPKIEIAGTAPDITATLKAGWNDMRTFEGTREIGLPYQLYLPDGYTAEKQYPVLLYMHGNGSRGTNNTTQISNDSAEIMKRIAASDEYKNDCIMIAAQNPTSRQWVDCSYAKGNYTMKTKMTVDLAVAKEIFDFWTAELSTDENRYYLYGNSMGAFACYDLMQRFPDTFAAAVTVAGGGDIAMADVLKNQNIWIHHGTTDKTVPYAASTEMSKALTDAGAGDNIKFTSYPGKAHTIFKEVGANPEVLKWLFSQSK